MGKKTIFTNITPLPPQVSRGVAIAMLHNHDEMIELNPLVIEHHPIKTPRDASKDEFLDCTWQEMTDRIAYAGGIVKGKVSYKGCFHNLPTGLQTHIYAPMSLDIREKWTICGTLAGEPDEPRELGLNTPRRGLYLREDGEIKCNVLMTGFVRKNLDHAHKVLVERILAKAERVQAHLNASTCSSLGNGTPSYTPAFQPGSHMSTSSIVRQMRNPTEQYFATERSIPPRLSSGLAATQTVKSPLREDGIHELPGSVPNGNQEAAPRRPAEDEDDAELAAIHPALREQYRQSRDQKLGRSDTALPAYHTLQHQQGQFYHQDIAKRSAGKQFAVELEGSTAFTPAESLSAGARLQYRNTCDISELGDSAFELSMKPGQADGYNLFRSHGQPLPEAETDTQVDVVPLSHDRTFDRFSVISKMSTPKAGQFAFSNSADNRFSVVSALTTSDIPTPRFQQLSFAEQQRQAQGQAYVQQDSLRQKPIYAQQAGQYLDLQQGSYL